MATIISDMPTGRLAAPRPAKNPAKNPANNPTKIAIKTGAEAARTSMRPPLLWLQRLFWRAELRALDAAQLRDCGLDPAAVAREAMKPFWRD
jgi:uncharacterized protein YjiS (DUF1127 family)